MKLKKTDELVTYRLECGMSTYNLKWLSTMADDNQIKDLLLPYIQGVQPSTMEQLKVTIPIPGIRFVLPSEAESLLYKGYVSICFDSKDAFELAVIPMIKQQYRSIDEPKEEFSELGPNEAFTESLETNLYILRRRLPIDQIKVDQLEFDHGRIKGALLYLNEAGPIEVTKKLEQKVQKTFEKYSSSIIDISTLSIAKIGLTSSLSKSDLLTEHPIQCIRYLMHGRVVLLLEGSRKGLIAPTYISDYFQVAADYYMALPFVFLIRCIRIFSFVMAVSILPMYIAVINFHYQMIPSKVIETLYRSRYAIPFPAFFEALIMELTLLVLLEAVARLPTKLSLSAGVVAGIILGTAAVEARLISNVMIVLMGVTALFTLTSTSVSIRNLLFVNCIPALILANFMGINGIFLFWYLFLTRMLKIKFLGHPFATFGLQQLAYFLRRRE